MYTTDHDRERVVTYQATYTLAGPPELRWGNLKIITMTDAITGATALFDCPLIIHTPYMTPYETRSLRARWRRRREEHTTPDHTATQTHGPVPFFVIGEVLIVTIEIRHSTTL
jgi:hypothetical protein